MAKTSAAHSESAPAKARRPFWRGLGFQVAVAMVLGVIVGVVWPEQSNNVKLLGDIFLKLIKTVVAPLVFLTVVAGVGAAGSGKQLGRIGAVSLIYFEIFSTLALLFGLGMGMLLQVGKGVANVGASAAAHKAAEAAEAAAKSTHTDLGGFVMNIFPDNFLGAFAKGEIMQVLVLALIFGIGMHALKPDHRKAIQGGLDTISHGFYAFTNVILALAPIGAFGSMAYAVGSNGLSVLVVLAWFVVTYYFVQIAFIVVVLGAACLAARISLWSILRFIRDEIFVVLGTASSESVLPALLEKLPTYGVSKQAVGLILPTGYVFNLGGAAIYLTMGLIFVCNVFNVHLTTAQLFSTVLVMLVTSKGVATVTGGAFVTFAATITAIGIVPLEGLPLMFGVYRLMAPANSTANAVGNAIATVVIAKICGEYDPANRTEATDAVA